MTLDEIIAELRAADEIVLEEEREGQVDQRRVSFVEVIGLLYDFADVRGKDAFPPPRIEVEAGRRIAHLGPLNGTRLAT